MQVVQVQAEQLNTTRRLVNLMAQWQLKMEILSLSIISAIMINQIYRRWVGGSVN